MPADILNVSLINQNSSMKGRNVSIKDTRTVYKHLRSPVLIGSGADGSRYGCQPSRGRVRRSDVALRDGRHRNVTRRLISNRMKGITIKFIKRAAHICRQTRPHGQISLR